MTSERKTLRHVFYNDDYGKRIKGYFHQWGTRAYPADNGQDFGVTIAIIENEDGQILTIAPEDVKFE